MKKNGAAKALITPDATGWRLRMGDADQSIASLEEAVLRLQAARRAYRSEEEKHEQREGKPHGSTDRRLPPGEDQTVAGRDEGG